MNNDLRLIIVAHCGIELKKVRVGLKKKWTYFANHKQVIKWRYKDLGDFMELIVIIDSII